MFWNNKYKQEIKELGWRLERQQDNAKYYENLYNKTEENRYTDEINAERNKLKFVFDLTKVIGIERINIGAYQEHTILTYQKPDTFGEWHFFCSRETHSELADEFSEYLKHKNKI